jgi:flagellar basal body L-ring protein FlgH
MVTMTLRPKRRVLAVVLAVLATAAPGNMLWAQEGSLMHSSPQTGRPLTLQNGSFIYRDLPEESRARPLKERDIVTVIVNYNSRLLSEGDAESRKTSNIAMALADWLRFDGKSIKAAPQTNGDPTISGRYNSQYRAESDVELRDSLTFKIACEITEVLPGHRRQPPCDRETNRNRWPPVRFSA